MSLIIGLICKDGCLVIADTRSHIKANGTLTYDDTFEKVVFNKGHIVYNHGYNRIYDNDWKLCRDQLVPDKNKSIYRELATEMKQKEDKTAFYVFMNKKTMCEIKISATGEITLTDHLQDDHDRIVSGTGAKYVDLGLLTDLKKKKCKKVIPLLKKTFLNAHEKMVKSGGNEFCKNYIIRQFFG